MTIGKGEIVRKFLLGPKKTGTKQVGKGRESRTKEDFFPFLICKKSARTSTTDQRSRYPADIRKIDRQCKARVRGGETVIRRLED